ncbi:MAG: MBL fold metallo-hydrolase [Pseudonocardiales bacterium]|nr:MBL fold metallo-hydrolase [Pseudonocardiales bacterium]
MVAPRFGPFRPSYRDRLTAPLPGPAQLYRLFRTGGFRGSSTGAEQVPRDTAGLPLLDSSAPASLTWIGHASFLIRLGGLAVLADPVLSPRLPGVGPRLTPPGLSWEQLPRIDAVVISHDHYDHLDAPTMRLLPRDTRMLVPVGLGRWFRQHGFSVVHELDWWESVRLGEVEFTFVPVHHWSRRGPFDTCRSLWGGWVLTGQDGSRLFHAGDSGYGHRFAEIGRRMPGIDVAMLPIGAYDPRWFMRPMHMDPTEAVQALSDLGAQRLATMHWGTFVLTREPVLEPLERVHAAWAATDHDRADLWDMAVGETRTVGTERDEPSAASAQWEPSG